VAKGGGKKSAIGIVNASGDKKNRGVGQCLGGETRETIYVQERQKELPYVSPKKTSFDGNSNLACTDITKKGGGENPNVSKHKPVKGLRAGWKKGRKLQTAVGGKCSKCTGREGKKIYRYRWTMNTQSCPALCIRQVSEGGAREKTEKKAS